MFRYMMFYLAGHKDRKAYQPEFDARDDTEALRIATDKLADVRLAGGDPSDFRLFKEIK